MGYSHDSGGTLTLPSPTHVHHVDMTAAVRSLRRSLSRSPSKFHLTGPSQPPLAAAAPTTTSPKDAPAAPEGLLATPNASSSSSGQYLSFPSAHQIFDTAALLSPHNLTPSTYTPKSSLKLSVRSARPKPVVTRPLSRTRVSPKSPLKRVFGVSPDSGNSNLPALPSPTAAQGQENLGDMILGSSPASRRHPERSSRHSLHLDVSGSSKSSISRLLDATEAFPSSTVSPLKRNDATMNLDQASLGSPVAKRRSLHGISSFGNDFNIFDHPINPTPSADAQDDANQEYQLSGSSAASFRDPLPSPTPVVSRRTTSLRKSTLQQRHDGNATRTSWGRRAGEKQLAQLTNDASSPNSRFRPRLSLDQYVPLENERGSPFAPGPLPNPSVHPATRQAHQPHPLSRTITQSSSSSASLQDETPTHVPIKVGERPRVPFSFAKSLPPGASRPLVSMSTEQAVATPNYKHAKPFQGAFMSTGLVSKVNRNPEQLPANKFASSKPTFVMPDTPCKKQSYPSATFPPHPGSGRRSSRPSFGSPTTPFNSAPKASPRDKTGDALFRPNRSSHGRKGSVFSVDGDDNVDLHGAGDDILPPTPTKNLFRTSILGTNARQSASPLSADLGPRKAASPIRTTLERNLDREGSPLKNFMDSMMGPPDASRLSISNQQDFSLPPPSRGDPSANLPPATPTMEGREVFLGLGGANHGLSITPNNRQSPSDVDEVLLKMFDKADMVGTGEFSQVYRVSKKPRPATFNGFSTPSWRTPPTPEPAVVYAVKKVRLPANSTRGRLARYQEVKILDILSHSDKVVHYIRSWEQNECLYIQTEFCEEGSLEHFLKSAGNVGRLDDFRIWKILIEACQGLVAIHDANIIHLDLKPANILVDREGYLKIADFGMATFLPAAPGIEGEGDREYIGPEILRGQFDKPADVFSLGLIILEMACNVFLPDNGPAWQALRSGNLSGVPPLTNPEWVHAARDASGNPILPDAKTSPLLDDPGLPGSMGASSSAQQGFPFEFTDKTHDPSNLFGSPRRASFDPPSFMLDSHHVDSLDRIVRWMLAPDPKERPAARDLLSATPLRWVAARRLAGATVFEGNWGSQSVAAETPLRVTNTATQSDHSDMDTVMTDV